MCVCMFVGLMCDNAFSLTQRMCCFARGTGRIGPRMCILYTHTLSAHAHAQWNAEANHTLPTSIPSARCQPVVRSSASTGRAGNTQQQPRNSDVVVAAPVQQILASPRQRHELTQPNGNGTCILYRWQDWPVLRSSGELYANTSQRRLRRKLCPMTPREVQTRQQVLQCGWPVACCNTVLCDCHARCLPGKAQTKNPTSSGDGSS